MMAVAGEPELLGVHAAEAIQEAALGDADAAMQFFDEASAEQSDSASQSTISGAVSQMSSHGDEQLLENAPADEQEEPVELPPGEDALPPMEDEFFEEPPSGSDNEDDGEGGPAAAEQLLHAWQLEDEDEEEEEQEEEWAG